MIDMGDSGPAERRNIRTASLMNRTVHRAIRHGALQFTFLNGIWAGLPWLTPLVTGHGWDQAADAIESKFRRVGVEI